MNSLCETSLSNKNHHFAGFILRKSCALYVSRQNPPSASQGRLAADKRIHSFPHCFYIPPLPRPPTSRPSLSLHHRAHPSEHLLVPPAGEPARFRSRTTSKASLIISSSCFSPRTSHPPPPNQTTSCAPQPSRSLSVPPPVPILLG